MRLLGIECSSDMLSLGAVQDDRTIFSYRRNFSRSASSALVHCQRLLTANALCIRDFDGFVVGAGPGSFTGLRIAFSIVKGWRCAHDKPVVSLGSFLSIAEKVKKHAPRIAVIADARRDLIYAAAYSVRSGEVLKKTKERLCPMDEFVPGHSDHLFVCYDSRLREKLVTEYPGADVYGKDVWPDILPLLKKAYRVYKGSNALPAGRMEPLYMYPKTCQVRNV